MASSGAHAIWSFIQYTRAAAIHVENRKLSAYQASVQLSGAQAGVGILGKSLIQSEHALYFGCIHFKARNKQTADRRRQSVERHGLSPSITCSASPEASR
jgi:hypothetical protein